MTSNGHLPYSYTYSSACWALWGERKWTRPVLYTTDLNLSIWFTECFPACSLFHVTFAYCRLVVTGVVYYCSYLSLPGSYMRMGTTGESSLPYNMNFISFSLLRKYLHTQNTWWHLGQCYRPMSSGGRGDLDAFFTCCCLLVVLFSSPLDKEEMYLAHRELPMWTPLK